MREREPVETVADLATLNDGEIIEGYFDGYDDCPAPGNNRSRSYWHGWRNGAADAGNIEHDAPMRRLAHEIVRNPRAT